MSRWRLPGAASSNTSGAADTQVSNESTLIWNMGRMPGTQAQVGRVLALGPALSGSRVSPSACAPGKTGLSQAGGDGAGAVASSGPPLPCPAPSKAASWLAGWEQQATVFALDRAWSVFPDGAGTGRELWQGEDCASFPSCLAKGRHGPQFHFCH